MLILADGCPVLLDTSPRSSARDAVIGRKGTPHVRQREAAAAGSSSQSLEKLKHSVAKTNLASSFKFSIPELKVGTMDVLLSVSDGLSKLEPQAERVMQRTAQCMAEVMEQSSEKVAENALASSVDLVSYVTKFQWDRAKYSTTLPRKSLAGIIAKVNFSEVFVAWIHLKVLGLFVESVLRYGLLVSFQALLLQPDKKRTKNLREQLSSLFGHLDPTAPATPSSKLDMR
ncbi:unnamed protein product, partial [Coregonus sp. 'balchen']